MRRRDFIAGLGSMAAWALPVVGSLADGALPFRAVSGLAEGAITDQTAESFAATPWPSVLSYC
jgi:hypothetical protein